MTEYQILTATDPATLAAAVEAALADGWTCQGGVACAADGAGAAGGTVIYAQALTKTS